MGPFVCLALAPALSLSQMAAAHAATTQAAITVRVTVKSPRESAAFDYDLYFKAPNTARLDFRRAGRSFIVLAKGAATSVFEPSSGRILHRKSSSATDPAKSIALALGQADPMMRVYLDPKKGFRAFVSQFGDLTYRAAGDKLVARFRSGKGSVTLFADQRTHLLSGAAMDTGDGSSATWTVTRAPASPSAALAYKPPASALPVASLKEPWAKITYDSAADADIVSRSRKAYADLVGMNFHSEAFVFTARGDSKRSSDTAWARNGRFDYDLHQDRPKRQFKASFDGRWLATSDAGIRKRTADSPAKLLGALEKTNAPLEPLTIALLRGRNFYKWIEADDVRYTSRGKAKLNGIDCSVVEGKAAEGWKLTLYIRADGLIGRIDRDNGKTTPEERYSESVFYRYSRVSPPRK